MFDWVSERALPAEMRVAGKPTVVGTRVDSSVSSSTRVKVISIGACTSVSRSLSCSFAILLLSLSMFRWSISTLGDASALGAALSIPKFVILANNEANESVPVPIPAEVMDPPGLTNAAEAEEAATGAGGEEE